MVRLLTVLTVSLFVVAVPLPAAAQQASSTSYSIDEAFFGTGGQLCDPGVSGTSTSYCAKSAAGELGVGRTSSTSYQAQAGQNTNREEFIEVKFNNTAECGTSSSLTPDLGQLSVSTTKTYAAYFSVKTYLSNGGYIVRTAGAPPKVTSGTSYTLATPNSGTGSNSAGTERFGINLVANTTPAIGAAPVQKPDGTFSTGQASAGYNTPNSFRYVDGEAIADSNGASSGLTCYTMSYLYNIGSATPAGEYKFTQSIVATSTY